MWSIWLSSLRKLRKGKFVDEARRTQGNPELGGKLPPCPVPGAATLTWVRVKVKSHQTARIGRDRTTRTEHTPVGICRIFVLSTVSVVYLSAEHWFLLYCASQPKPTRIGDRLRVTINAALQQTYKNSYSELGWWLVQLDCLHQKIHRTGVQQGANCVSHTGDKSHYFPV